MQDSNLGGIPDYDQPVEVLYTNIVKAFFEEYQSLDVICFATIFQNLTNSESSLPSWVPDWRVSVFPLVVPLMVSQGGNKSIGNFRPFPTSDVGPMYNATRGLRLQVAFEHGSQDLHCSGSVLGAIDCLAAYPAVEGGHWASAGYELVDTLSREPEYWFDGRKTLPTIAADLMLTIMRCLVLDREDHYLSQHAPLMRFLAEFRTLLSEAKNGGSELHAEFHTWYEANKHLRIRGITLETLATEFVNAWETPTHLRQASRRKGFFSRFHDTTIKMKRRLAQL